MADPGSRVQIRIVSGETMLSSQDRVKAVTAAVGAETELAVHYLPSETWMFSGSQAAIAAMSEYWREHFGVIADELTDDHDVGLVPE